MTPNLRLVGQRLKEYMQLRGLTISSVARMSRFSVKELNAMIEGKRYPVSRLMLLLSLFEDINPRWLLHGETPMLLKGMPRPVREIPSDAEARSELQRYGPVLKEAHAAHPKLSAQEEVQQLRAALDALTLLVAEQGERLSRLEAAQRADA